MLIAASSGRALAAAARQAGYVPLVADLFHDLDTRALAGASRRVPGTLSGGLRRGPLLAALDGLARGRATAGLVWGTGFEDRPALLRDLASRHRLLGNGADAVARAKDPRGMAALCGTLGIPHPALRESPPTAPADWVEKRRGGAGGGHVRPASADAPRRRGRYWQRRVGGRPVSALFVANGRDAMVLGLSEQWADPTDEQPFRYGGAVRPATVDPDIAAAIGAAVPRLAATLRLVGLNSADFLVREGGFDLLEINPRPGATLDIYACADGTLFRMHVEACEGQLPAAAPALPGAAAAAFVYADRAVTLPPGFAWPDWTADQQLSGAAVGEGAPLCTVLARAADPDAARDLLRRRTSSIRLLAGLAP